MVWRVELPDCKFRVKAKRADVGLGLAGRNVENERGRIVQNQLDDGLRTRYSSIYDSEHERGRR